ncbi:MAG: threonine synthase [Chitinophagaceae bacterium]|nr:threonine synthase [Chitinophagaceae bacterium]
MKYYSLNKRSQDVDFREAAIRGQASDKGLYFPASIPVLPASFFEKIGEYSKEAIALQVIAPYTGDTIPAKALERIVGETVNFEFPLVRVTDDIFSLELFHGPTLAFKDVGARFMSRCLGYFFKEKKNKAVVLVATSGDTGGAVADGFYGVEGIDVIILYPSGKVSAVQEKQLTTLGKNIHALEIEGSFDDCQRMVKQAFMDEELNKALFLTSANSINVARWLPQQFYYFFAWKQWQKENSTLSGALPPLVVSTPSGNFGNLCAGLLAYRSGLPIDHFIAACNANDAVTQYFKNGKYQPQPARATLSNAMDVGDPSNFVRMLELFDSEYGALKNLISSYSVSDEETRETIREVYTKFNYLPDPHGAVAYASLVRYFKEYADAQGASGMKGKEERRPQGIFLETAHPIKFYDVVEPVTGKPVDMPAAIRDIIHKEKVSLRMSNAFGELKEYLLRK